MVVSRHDPLTRQDDDPLGPGHDVISRVGEVAPLDHDVAGTRGPDALSHRNPGVERPEGVDVPVAEHGGLPQVGCDDQCVRQQQLQVRSHSLGLQQWVAGGRHQDRVHHQLGEQSAGGQIGHRCHDPRGGQHAGLHAPYVEVVEDRLDLLAHEGRLEGDDTAHLGRVLRGHRGQGAGAVHPQRGEGLEVGLGTRTSARVGAGDGQRRRRRRVRHRATIGGRRGIVVR